MSNVERNFSNNPVFELAKQFQADLKREGFFIFRRGKRSFDGWRLKEVSTNEIIFRHRALTDADFEPVLTQKQVDMKIGLDIAKRALKKTVGRILLSTADMDFVPAIHFARSNGLEVVLLSDGHASLKIKRDLINACNTHRIVS